MGVFYCFVLCVVVLGGGSLDNSLAVLYTRTRIHLGYVVEAIPTVGS